MPVAYTIAQDTPANGQILFSLVNPIQTNGSSTDVIFVNVFRCASDDFRYYQAHQFTTTRLTPVSEAFKAKANYRFTTKSESILPNSLVQLMDGQTRTVLGDGPKVLFDRMTEDEEILSHNDFLHRYHVAQAYSGALCALYPMAGDAYYWLTSFRAYRGSTRHRPGSYGNLDGLYLTSQTQEDVISCGAYILDDIVPIEVPYNNNIRFLPLRNPETIWKDGYVRNVRTTTDASKPHMWSAGDDFTLGLRTTPLPIMITF
jgi:hypothetical protein